MAQNGAYRHNPLPESTGIDPVSLRGTTKVSLVGEGRWLRSMLSKQPATTTDTPQGSGCVRAKRLFGNEPRSSYRLVKRRFFSVRNYVY